MHKNLYFYFLYFFDIQGKKVVQHYNAKLIANFELIFDSNTNRTNNDRSIES